MAKPPSDRIPPAALHASGSLEPAEFADTAVSGESLLPVDDGDPVLAAGARYLAAEPPLEIGRGGLGRVLLVMDPVIGRRVALKEIHLGTATPASARRFVREARVTGQLEHPSIVPVYDLCRDSDGRLSYVMRRIEGQTLSTAIAAASSMAERLALVPHVRALCHAVAYAHSRGVIHRDIKPQNVMVGPFGETVLLDWGLARRHGEAAEPVDIDTEEVTRPGVSQGTPSYMAPEQARGDGDAVGQTTDVWALGAVLFEVLTGRPPYLGTSVTAVLTSAAVGLPPAVRSLAKDAPGDLCAVVTRCLMKDNAARYPTAEAMGADLDAWLSGRRVSAHLYTSAELLRRRFGQAYRLPLLVALGALVALTVAGVVSTLRVRRERDEMRALSTFVLSEVSQGLVQVPGDRRLVLDLASRIQDGFKRLGQALDAPYADRLVLRDAAVRLGVLQYDLGRYPEAEASYRLAARLSDSLHAEHPSARHQAEAALDRASIAYTLARLDRSAEAARFVEEALAMTTAAQVQDAADAVALRAESLAISVKLSLEQEEGRFAEALPLAYRAMELDERIAHATGQADARDFFNRFLGFAQIVELARSAGRPEATAAATGQMLETLATFEGRFPGTVDLAEAQFHGHQYAALVATDDGRTQEAAQHLAAARTAVRWLLEREPDNASYQGLRLLNAVRSRHARRDPRRARAAPDLAGGAGVAGGSPRGRRPRPAGAGNEPEAPPGLVGGARGAASPRR